MRTQGKYLQVCLRIYGRYVMIGHSERRSIFDETDEAVNLKIKAALGDGHDSDTVHRRES